MWYGFSSKDGLISIARTKTMMIKYYKSGLRCLKNQNGRYVLWANKNTDCEDIYIYNSLDKAIEDGWKNEVDNYLKDSSNVLRIR